MSVHFCISTRMASRLVKWFGVLRSFSVLPWPRVFASKFQLDSRLGGRVLTIRRFGRDSNGGPRRYLNFPRMEGVADALMS